MMSPCRRRSLGRFCRGPSRRSTRGAGPSPRVCFRRPHPPSLRVHTAPSRMDSASKQEAQPRSSRHNERRSSEVRGTTRNLWCELIIPGDCVFQPGLSELFRRKEGAKEGFWLAHLRSLKPPAPPSFSALCRQPTCASASAISWASSAPVLPCCSPYSPCRRKISGCRCLCAHRFLASLQKPRCGLEFRPVSGSPPQTHV